MDKITRCTSRKLDYTECMMLLNVCEFATHNMHMGENQTQFVVSLITELREYE